MNQLHIVMNGKGGVGKSIVASTIAQYLKSLDPKALSIDTDPLTPTLYNYKALDPIHIQIASEAEVYLNRFDEMTERIVSTDKDVLIDTGASTFLPIAKYIKSNSVFEVMKTDYSKDVFIHVVINAQTQNDYLATTTSLALITKQFAGSCKIIVWLNEFGGDLGKFEESAYYEENKNSFFGIVRFPNPDELLLADIKSMLQKFQVYEEALADPNLFVMARSRIRRQRDGIYQQLNQII